MAEEAGCDVLVAGIFQGGGAKGAAYGGALAEFEAQGAWFSKVAGASAGAITAALIAAGLRSEDLRLVTAVGLGKLADQLPRSKFDAKRIVRCAERFRRTGGFLDATDLEQWLVQEMCRGAGLTERPSFAGLFEATGIELNVIVTSTSSHRQMVFNHVRAPRTDVAKAVIASAAIPGGFPPGYLVRTDQIVELLVDGGAWANYPEFIFRNRSYRQWALRLPLMEDFADATHDPTSFDEPVVGFVLDPRPAHGQARLTRHRLARYIGRFNAEAFAEFRSREDAQWLDRYEAVHRPGVGRDLDLPPAHMYDDLDPEHWMHPDRVAHIDEMQAVHGLRPWDLLEDPHGERVYDEPRSATEAEPAGPATEEPGRLGRLGTAARSLLIGRSAGAGLVRASLSMVLLIVVVPWLLLRGADVSDNGVAAYLAAGSIFVGTFLTYFSVPVAAGSNLGDPGWPTALWPVSVLIGWARRLGWLSLVLVVAPAALAGWWISSSLEWTATEDGVWSRLGYLWGLGLIGATLTLLAALAVAVIVFAALGARLITGSAVGLVKTVFASNTAAAQWIGFHPDDHAIWVPVPEELGTLSFRLPARANDMEVFRDAPPAVTADDALWAWTRLQTRLAIHETLWLIRSRRDLAGLPENVRHRFASTTRLRLVTVDETGEERRAVLDTHNIGGEVYLLGDVGHRKWVDDLRAEPAATLLIGSDDAISLPIRATVIDDAAERRRVLEDLQLLRGHRITRALDEFVDGSPIVRLDLSDYATPIR